MGQKQLNASLSCNKCYNHYIIEIITNKNNFLIRRFCYCGETTTDVNYTHKQLHLLKFKYYRLCSCYSKSKTKYCYDCKKFICDNCLKLHKNNHNKIMLSKFVLTCCKYHLEERLECFCKKCKKPICSKCIESFHKDHEIKYMKDLIITNDMIENYKNNILKLYQEFENYLQLKYGKKIKIDISILTVNKYGLNKKGDYDKYDLLNDYEKNIIYILRLLLTIIELYNYYTIKRRVTYQIIANVLKHKNIELIKIPPEKPINQMNIFLKINLFDEEIRKNQIIIEYNQELAKINDASKLIKLKNGDLCGFGGKEKKIVFFKNYIKHDYFIPLNYDICDIIQLKNQNLVFSVNDKIIIYKNKEDIIFNKDMEIYLNIK